MPRIEVQGLAGTFGTLADLENEPPVSWLISKWLAAREISCIYGQGGTFKSYVALGWSLQLAAVKDIPCMYVAAEGASGLRSRVDAWLAARAMPGKTDLPWYYYNAGFHIDEETDTGMWINGLKTFVKERSKPRLVVVDTLARNFGGDENAAKDMGRFIEGCEHLRR